MSVTPLPLEKLFASRAHHYEPSPIRAIFDLEIGDDCISLAGGNPDLSLLPWEEITKSVSTIIEEDGQLALQYGATTGRAELTQAIVDLMAIEGIEAEPNEIIVTCGSQMSLELISKLFINPADVVFAAAPTYSGAINAFQSMEANVVQLEQDEEGITPDALLNGIAEAKESGATPKLLYVIPNFANPSGIMMSEARRHAIATVCRENNIVIVEDNPYGLINFTGERPTPLRMIDPANVIYLGSMSKIFSPGIRIGWADAPTKVHASLVPAAESTAICPSLLSQFITESYLRDHDWKSIQADSVEMYRRRMESLLRGLEEFMPEGVTWTRPTGGFFIWLTLPEHIDTQALLPAAIDAGLIYIPGPAFYAEEGRGRNELRLSFSQESEEKLYEAARRLGRLLEEKAL